MVDGRWYLCLPSHALLCSSTPLTTLTLLHFSHTHSASEILRAQHVFNAESEKLSQATRLAELAHMASHNFEVMIAEKRELARAMRSLSRPRLRWIKAINMVLIRLYVVHVKTRLLNSSFKNWYTRLIGKAQTNKDAEAEKAPIAARVLTRISPRTSSLTSAGFEEAKSRGLSEIVGTSAKGRDKTQSVKTLKTRRSMDNSEFPQLGTEPTRPSLTSSSGKTASTASLPSLGSPSNKVERLLLDPMERRRQAKAEREGKSAKSGKSLTLSRKSSNGEIDLEKEKSGTSPPVRNKPSPDKPPSLLDSYAEKIPIVKETLAVGELASTPKSAARKARN
jgi:hypothetical protein